MKTTIIFFLSMIISVNSFGQEKKQYTDEIKGISVSPPRFVGDELNIGDTKTGGNVELINYLNKNIQYPENSLLWGKEGREVIQYVVTSNGRLTDFHVLNSISPEMDQEAIRVLKTTDRMWNPGLNNGKPVDMENEISLAFKLYEGTDHVKEFLVQAKHYFAKGGKKLFFKGDMKSALRCYKKVVSYMPYDKCSLLSRGICKFDLGDKEGACQDWNRVKSLGGFESNSYLNNFCEFKGYSEMMSMLQDKE